MTRLQLPDVTLLCIDTICHDLAAMAIGDCLANVDFGDALFYSNKSCGSPIEGSRWPILPCDVIDMASYQRFLWQEAWKPVRTSHVLVVQWDSWIVHPNLWTDEFLKYDYIGAPWWHKDGFNVGNGGFSLRSRELMEICSEIDLRDTDKEDELICRWWRRWFEQNGCKFAPETLAHKFAFECTAPHSTFGFHAFRNWPFVLDNEQLKLRCQMAAKIPYIRDQADQWTWMIHNSVVRT